MKKICLFLLFVSTMLSCSVVEKRNDKWPAPDIFANFKGGQSEDADTKTALEFDPTTGTSHVYWCPGDELNVFFDTKSVKYQSTNTENSRSAVLRTEESVSEEEFLSTNLWGLYPYDEDAVCDGSSIVTSLSNSQSGVPNSFDDDLALMVAKSSDRNMFFMNVCGGLKFSLTRDDIKSITFRGNNEENLSGQLKIQIEDGQPVVTCKDGDKSVTLTPKEGDTFEKDVDYILMTLPANLEKGFTMSFDLDNARGELVYEKAVSLPRGDLGVKRSIDALATFEYDVTGISLDKTSAVMKVGESVQLVATVLPENATDKNVIWSSSDESVATVTDGNVTAVSLGSCTIMAISGEFSAACEITVVPTLVTSVTLDKTTATLRAGETVILTATVNPEDATDKTVEWSTSDASVATVENGVITAVKVGPATITAKAGDKTATCEITVVPTPVTSVTLDKTSASLKAGETVTLTATVNPSDATDKTVEWSTSDASVATVENGVVTAVKVGSATITAKAGDKTATCAVSVVATPVTSVTLDKTSASLKAGETVTLTATVNPSDATDKTVTWSTSDASVATVENGVVTAVKVGTATITAKAGDKTATCAVSVVATPVTSVTLDKTSASLKAGETLTLTATVNPSDATDKNVAWNTSDASIATVENGVVTAVKVGSATITAKAGDKTATCEITVVPTPVTSVTLDKTSASLKAGETVTLMATVNPSDATDKNVTWNTSDASIATVENGVVTAVKVGSATITAKAGDKTATCEITVVPTPVTSVTLDKTEVSLKEGEQVKLYATISPTNATNKTVLWSSTNSNVASVDGQGNVSAISVGSAVITVTTEDGNFSASCFATVSEEIHPVLGVSLNKTTLELNKGESETLLATVYPENATNKNVTWESVHPDIVSVNNSGEVKAVGGGFTRVMVITDDGSWTAICNISVSVPVTGVTLDKVEASMKVGEQLQLNATIAPGDATNKNCVWESSNQSLAIVEDGLVTAIKSGNVTISVKSEDGNKTAYCNVKIKSDGFDPSIGEWVEGEGGEGTAE